MGVHMIAAQLRNRRALPFRHAAERSRYVAVHAIIPTVAVLVLLCCCKSDMQTGPAKPVDEGKDNAATDTTVTDKMAGLPEVAINLAPQHDMEAPDLRQTSSWLEAGLKQQGDVFPAKARQGRLTGSYRAARASANDASGRVVGSVSFKLRLDDGRGQTFRTEALVGEQLEGDTRAGLAKLVEQVASEVTANLAKQVRVRRASDDELVKMLETDKGDTELVSFAVTEVRTRKVKEAEEPLIALLEHPERDVVNLAASALGDVGTRRATPKLIAAGSRVKPVDRLPILYALGELGGPEAEVYLETLAKETKDPFVKGAAERALARARR